MSSDKYYYQCRLRKNVYLGTVSHEVSWIPEKFAKKGKVLKIKRGNIWDDGWEVINVWGKKEKKEIMEQSQYHKFHRHATDI